MGNTPWVIETAKVDEPVKIRLTDGFVKNSRSRLANPEE
jgi:hypothetical protein